MSAVTADSVSAMPRSLARLSAIASSRRIRPATASFVIGGSEIAPSSSRDACLCSQPEISRLQQVLRRLGAQNLQRALDPGPGRDRGTRGAAQVRVVEVRQPVRGGPHLAAHPSLLPGQHARALRSG